MECQTSNHTERSIRKKKLASFLLLWRMTVTQSSMITSYLNVDEIVLSQFRVTGFEAVILN